jgi:hypothetical protein
MPWFWGKKSKDDDDDESSGSSDDDSEEYSDEEYTDEEYTDGDEEEEAVSHVVVDHDNEEGVVASSEEAAAESSSAGPPELNGHNLSNDTSQHDDGGEASSADPQEKGREYDINLKLEQVSPPTLNSVRLADSSHGEDVSMIESDGLDSGDDEYLDTTTDDDDEGVSSDHESSLEDEIDAPPEVARESFTSISSQANNEVVRVETVDENESSESDEEQSDEDEEEEEGPTSFWEKQSLLALAAEHDRVDILKGILSDDDQDASALMDSGIPPLHIAISFGSTNTTQSLLRMGADPSIRPNIAEVKEQALEAPEGSKLEIPNMGRFDGVSAWELAFGNAAYEEHQKNHRSSWSMFNSSTSSLSMSSRRPADNTTNGEDRIIKPCDMAPSKREGIRHAFTAEALRCIGSDEVERLEQLLNSGMPASIDIGGKDLYDWAVQLGGLKCEEFLRPTEAAKHGTTDLTVDANSEEQLILKTPVENTNGEKGSSTAEPPSSTGKVLDRPGGEMTVSALINRLDELESLASALSTCLDNLAEEVSVCHGLLLMGGGASALASHVKSLKAMQDQKQRQLVDAQNEWEAAAQELSRWVKSAGPIGEEVVAMAPTSIRGQEYSRTESFRNAKADENDDDSQKRQQLLAQIAASENKILKLRASIADLSEENAREMEQVEIRGLTGGINLVRKLREELRDLEFGVGETKNRIATCRAQIGMIHSRLPKPHPKTAPVAKETQPVKSTPPPTSMESEDSNNSIEEDEGIVMVGRPGKEEVKDTVVDPSVTGDSSDENQSTRAPPEQGNASSATASATVGRPGPALPGHVEIKRKDNGKTPSLVPSSANMTESQRIATGESQALIVRPSGKRGYFTVDLWQVLLRIIGLDQAANRRGAQVAQKQKGSTANVMIV